LTGQPEAITVVLVSANLEWEVVRQYYAGASCGETPYGEWFERSMSQQRVIFLKGGWGKISAAASAQYAIDRWSPGLLVNLGTCGGLEGQVERGQLLLVTETLVYDIFERMGDAQQAIDHYTTRIELDGLTGPYPQPVTPARLVSADRDLDPQDIPLLRSRYEAVAVDWESGAIAWVAKKNQVRCLILRGVSDLVKETGGEAYLGDMGVFAEGARRIMLPLLDALPDWLNFACKRSAKDHLSSRE
jgi:adenosylhomocysteine nucleosidase